MVVFDTTENRREGAVWRKGLKEEKADTIRRMYRKGVSVARIARELSVSRPTVYRYVEEIRRWERHPSV